MVAGVGVAAGVAIKAGTALATAVQAGAGVGIAAGGGAAVAGTSSAVAVGSTVGVTGGVISGAAATGSAGGAVAGGLMGGASAAGVGGGGAGVGTLLAAGAVTATGVGLVVLGTSSSGNQVTYDCWKPVLHDTSKEPSSGMLLEDVIGHPHVAKVTMTGSDIPELPYIVLENIWKECFEIEYLILTENGKMVCHAKPVPYHE